MMNVPVWRRIHYDPTREDCEMNADEVEATREARKGITKTFSWSAANEEVLLVLCN
jgi:hypothetical protein